MADGSRPPAPPRQPGPTWTVPVEVARKLAPPGIQEVFLKLEIRGVRMKAQALVRTNAGKLLAEVTFLEPLPEGHKALSFPLAVRLVENA